MLVIIVTVTEYENLKQNSSAFSVCIVYPISIKAVGLHLPKTFQRLIFNVFCMYHAKSHATPAKTDRRRAYPTLFLQFELPRLSDHKFLLTGFIGSTSQGCHANCYRSCFPLPCLFDWFRHSASHLRSTSHFQCRTWAYDIAITVYLDIVDSQK